MDELHTLTPPQVDALLAAQHVLAAKADQRRERAADEVHRAANDEQNYQGRRLFWKMTLGEALTAVAALPADERGDAPRPRREVLARYQAALDAIDVIRAEMARLDAEWERRGRWSRFFMVPDGHIHSSMRCSTCNRLGQLTPFVWLPELSGRTEADAVAAHGALLCTVCFPSAPVEWTNGRELAKAAKAADRCPGSGKHAVSGSYDPRAYRKIGTCRVCGSRQSLSSLFNVRAHKAP